MTLVDIKSMALQEISEDFKKMNLPKYRAKQVYDFLVKGIEDFNDMTNLPINLRMELKQKYFIPKLSIEKKLISGYDGTIKYLFKLYDGEFIESVLMKYHHGYSICISTQVGCKMGCKFCATGQSGFSRNLFASEMLAQVQKAQIDNNIRISNIVLMGMGEPFDNYDNVIRFLKLVSCGDHLNIGMRHISLSTCGLVDKIYDLAKENFQLTLSISLHAPNDEIRNKIMPINKKFKVDELLDACKFYTEKTNRRISFEYAMISGVNDSAQCARELASKLKSMLCHVNLILANKSSKNNDYKKSSKKELDNFCKILLDKGINVTIRRTLGSDINASCGQLRRQVKKEEKI